MDRERTSEPRVIHVNTHNAYLVPTSVSRGEEAMPKKKQKSYYAVAKGRKPGIYTSWPEAESQVFQFSGAIYKGFFELDQAQEWLSQKGTIVHTSHGRYFRDQQGLSKEQVAYNELAEIRQIRAQHGRQAAQKIREQMGIEDLPSPEPLEWPDDEPIPQVETTPVELLSTSLLASASSEHTLPPDADLYTRRRLREEDSEDDEDTTKRRHMSPHRSTYARHDYRARRSASPQRTKRYQVP